MHFGHRQLEPVVLSAHLLRSTTQTASLGDDLALGQRTCLGTGSPPGGRAITDRVGDPSCGKPSGGCTNADPDCRTAIQARGDLVPRSPRQSRRCRQLRDVAAHELCSAQIIVWLALGGCRLAPVDGDDRVHEDLVGDADIDVVVGLEHGGGRFDRGDRAAGLIEADVLADLIVVAQVAPRAQRAGGIAAAETERDRERRDDAERARSRRAAAAPALTPRSGRRR